MWRVFMPIRRDRVKVIAVGKFDGLHRGHMALAKKVGKDGTLVVIQNHTAVLTPERKRDDVLGKECYYYELNNIKNLNGAEFVALLKRDFKNLKKIVVGYDFTFGAGRCCKALDLKELFDGEVEIVKEQFYHGISVHSYYIKEALKKGNIKEANALLGRKYSIDADVISGQGLGKKELFATLNLKVQGFILPKNGVYASLCKIDKTIYKSVSFIGIRQSTDGEFSVETHILDENIRQSVKQVELYFVDFIRENRKFDHLVALKEQIKKDIVQAKIALKEVKNG